MVAPEMSDPAPPPEIPVAAPTGRRLRWALAETGAVLRHAVVRAIRENAPDIAATLAYYTFLAIPATLLVALGVFGLFADRGTIHDVVVALEGVVPAAAVELIDQALRRVADETGTRTGLAAVGLVLALWTTSGAMSALMRALNRVHGVTDRRNIARKRGQAALLFCWVILAMALSFLLLVLGPVLSEHLGDAIDNPGLATRLWWSLQWPILIGGLFLAMLGILRAGPARPPVGKAPIVAGALVAIALWMAASGLFAIYTANFANYGAAWGSLSAVIVMLTWLWLSALAVLLGAYVEHEMERRAAARRGAAAARATA